MDSNPLRPLLAILYGDYRPPESFWRSLGYYHLYRLIVAGLFVVASTHAGTINYFASQDTPLALKVSVAYLALALVIPAVLTRWRPPFNLLLTAEVIVDIVVLTLLMYASGGNRSGLSYMLLVVLAAAGLVGQGRLTLFYAALATVAVLLEQGFRSLSEGADASDFTYTGIISIGFFATAISARLLAKRVVANEALANQRGVELANQLQINQRVIRDMQDGVLVVDSEGRVRQYNPQAALLCECAPPERPRLEDFSADLARRYPLWRQSATEVVDTLSMPGSGRMLRTRYLPSGEAENALIYLEDLEHIQAQAQQIKLVALGRLTANIAHEIRNPLAAISHAAELLTEERGSTMQARLTHIIGHNTQRLNQLVTDVLELGRRDRASPEPIALRQFIESLIDELTIISPNARECVALECEPSLRLYFDRGHLARVLSNLVENALRYCSGAGGSVRIRADAREFVERVDLSVIDDGPRIDDKTRSHLFEPFFTTRSNGTGLGLYIARELCEANGGSLELLDTAHGTEFRVSGRGGA